MEALNSTLSLKPILEKILSLSLKTAFVAGTKHPNWNKKGSLIFCLESFLSNIFYGFFFKTYLCHDLHYSNLFYVNTFTTHIRSCYQCEIVFRSSELKDFIKYLYRIYRLRIKTCKHSYKTWKLAASRHVIRDCYCKSHVKVGLSVQEIQKRSRQKNLK